MMQPHLPPRVSPKLALQPPEPGSLLPRLRPHLTSLAPRLELTPEPSPVAGRRCSLAAREQHWPRRKFRYRRSRATRLSIGGSLNVSMADRKHEPVRQAHIPDIHVSAFRRELPAVAADKPQVVAKVIVQAEFE